VLGQRGLEVPHCIACLALLRAQLGAHELELRGVRMLPVGHRRRLVLGVGDPLGGHRVGAEVAGHGAVFAHAVGALHALEERGHGVRIEAAVLEALQADAVRLALEIAGVGELSLDPRCLRAGSRAQRKVGPRAAEQDRGGERHHHRQLHLLLLVKHARDMALRDVGHLVREHRGELRFGLGGGDEAGMHADEAAR